MLGYTLKPILELVPEALPFIKQASLTQDYPVDSPDSCLASALAIEYAKATPGRVVDYDQLEKVASAVQVYGLQDKLNLISDYMVSRMKGGMQKQASVYEQGSYESREAFFEGELCSGKDVSYLTKTAQDLYGEAQATGKQPSLAVQKYSANAYLSKEAALTALGHRFHVTKNDVFIKLAAALGREPDILPPGPLVTSLCKTVSGMDKKANLDVSGFDFYKEALITKEAATSSSTVSLGGQNVPLQRIVDLPREHVSHYLGQDIAEGLSSDPTTAKAVVDSLPNDLKHVLSTLLKSC